MGDITNHRSIAPRRLHLGLTQEQLAERVGIRRQSLIPIERGLGSPSVEVALELATQLACSVEALFRPVPLDELLTWYQPPLGAAAHRALLKAKTPFLIASQDDGGSSTLLDSVIAELGPVAILPGPGTATMYRPPGCTFLEVHPDEASGWVRVGTPPDRVRGMRALIVPELFDVRGIALATLYAREAGLPLYSTIHAREKEFINEALRKLTAHDADVTTYWRNAGVIWVDRFTKSISVEKLMLIEPAGTGFIYERFGEWCSDVNNHVCRDAIGLQYAWGGHTWPGQVVNERDLGNFSNQGRFVHMSVMRDGRILMSGLEASIKPIAPGEQIPRGNQLFPGGLATLVTMDDLGAELAARAIVAWLMFNDDELPEIRRAFQQHVAQAITLMP